MEEEERTEDWRLDSLDSSRHLIDNHQGFVGIAVGEVGIRLTGWQQAGTVRVAACRSHAGLQAHHVGLVSLAAQLLEYRHGLSTKRLMQGMKRRMQRMEHASSAVLRASSHLGSKNLSHGRPNSQSSRVMAEEPRLAPEACELHLACDEQSLGTVPKVTVFRWSLGLEDVEAGLSQLLVEALLPPQGPK